ncbi:hypothetical protein OH76DRAFT_1487260 [Lentinus brumalis]|uniref:Homeobox domain-containing protein n=1 Tax=Lentinus brumalis TaxID=2498619 RepID=A0A371CV55_9APHY|nr:hypothetical protein OH76DRAFT_1487260 [Polyporus brumalis]
MAPTSWATEAEWDWMIARNSESADAARHGRYQPWFNGVSHDYFEQFSVRTRLYGDRTDLTPEEEAILAEAIKTRRRQLLNWFHNHRNRARKARATPYAAAVELRKGGRKRAPQGREVFCRLFYDDEHEAAVQEELKGAADDLGRKLTRAETMAISRAHVDSTFKAASDDMKAQVAARVAAEKESLLAASRTDDLDREPTPEEYQA